MVGIFCFIVFIGYLIIRRFLHPSLIPFLEELKCSNRFYITLNIFFFLFFSYSIISLYLRPDPYIRPIGYFISTTLMAVIVADEILFLSPQKSHIYFTLCKIIIIGLSLQYSQILIFPNLVGLDPWIHQWFTLKILDTGYIPEGFSYSKLPMMQLMIGMISLVTDLGYKMATMLSLSSIQIVCDTLFIFLLGKFLISNKIGLMAALLLEVANIHIQFGYLAIPNTMAAILILPIIFILLKLRSDKLFIGTSVVMLLMGTLILTHTMTSMFLAILLFVLWLSSLVYTRLFPLETGRSVTWTICILFSIGMFAYWSYISGHILTLANFIKLGFINPLPDWGYQSLSHLPLWEQMFKYIGLFLFFSISFIGCLYMISKQFRNSNRFISTIGWIVILCLAFFPLIIGKDIITGRWFYFSQILMAIPLSLSLLLINGIFKNQLIKGLLMSISIFFLSFLLIMSPAANIDNRFFFPNSGVRYAFTESELQAMETISEIWNGTVGGDWYIHLPYEIQLNLKFAKIDDSLYSGNFSEMQGLLIIIREEILNHTFYSPGRGIIKLNYNPYLSLEKQNFSLIYNCGSSRGYLQP